jgi:hypothetical protein
LSAEDLSGSQECYTEQNCCEKPVHVFRPPLLLVRKMPAQEAKWHQFNTLNLFRFYCPSRPERETGTFSMLSPGAWYVKPCSRTGYRPEWQSSPAWP